MGLPGRYVRHLISSLAECALGEDMGEAQPVKASIGTASRIGAMILGPLTKGSIIFRAAIVTAIVTQSWYLLDSLSFLAGVKGFLGLLHVDNRATVNAIYWILGSAKVAAYVVVLLLVSKLLTVYYRQKAEGALSLALKQGLLTEHEFQEKSSELQRGEVLRSIRELTS